MTATKYPEYHYPQTRPLPQQGGGYLPQIARFPTSSAIPHTSPETKTRISQLSQPLQQSGSQSLKPDIIAPELSTTVKVPSTERHSLQSGPPSQSSASPQQSEDNITLSKTDNITTNTSPAPISYVANNASSTPTPNISTTEHQKPQISSPPQQSVNNHRPEFDRKIAIPSLTTDTSSSVPFPYVARSYMTKSSSRAPDAWTRPLLKNGGYRPKIGRVYPVSTPSNPSILSLPRPGKWLPGDTGLIQKWVHEMIEHVRVHPQPFHPVINEFKDLIEGDPSLYMLFHSMFREVPKKYKKPITDPDVKKKPKSGEGSISGASERDNGGETYYISSFTAPNERYAYTTTYDKSKEHREKEKKYKKVESYIHMLELFNYLLTTPPAFNSSGMVGVPFNAILDWPMGTPAGNAAFLSPKVNAMFKKLLDQWAHFLSSSDSTTVLNTKKHGWLGPDAMEAMMDASRGRRGWGFEHEYVCDPDAKHYGFTSWDDFFTRRFRPEVRDIDEKYVNDANVIVNACESAPFAISHDVKALDQFWVKGQPYSLMHMLDHDPTAERFVGGTIYQAFLSALSYHRWHAPISGTVVKTSLVPGTYFSESQYYDFPDTDPDAPDASQGYITAVATRALIFIQADNEKIGLMCFVAVGMADVSTCDIGVYEGQHITKGQEIGMFHFGGSTYCLVFRPEVELEFDLHDQKGKAGIKAKNIRLNERLATVL